MQKINFNDRYDLTQAVIAGRKIMTRRLINLNSTSDVPVRIFAGYIQIIGRSGNVCVEKKLSYKVGEIVAVAQSYRAAGFDPEYCIEGGTYAKKHAGWRNKMFVSAKYMPHQIRITGIRCERLQDISDEDCLLEGVMEHPYIGYVVDGILYKGHKDYEYNEPMIIFQTPRDAFAMLIDKVSGRGTWASNPWVVVYEFELVK